MIKLAEHPRYALYADAVHESYRDEVLGRWRFVLQAVDSDERIEASDWEPSQSLERLQLLTVIRGLEELDQPSAVTIYTASGYVAHGIGVGLSEWRECSWMWERFGELVPITNDDLWRRFDRAGRFHRFTCRSWRRGDGFVERGMPAVARVAARAKPSVRPAAKPREIHVGWVKRLSRIASSIVPV
jgi:ribonuclease HI